MQIVLLHRTPNRARYRCSFPGEGLNLERMRSDLQALEGVTAVRINPRAASIVFEFDDIGLEAIEAKLRSLNEGEYRVCDTFSHTDTCFLHRENTPSKAGIYRAAGALAAEPFIGNETAKLLISGAAAAPLLAEGVKALFSEGITSRVLEAAAVGVSLARRDYLAANGTNAMLELGEYIEETTVAESDDLIRELAKPNVEESWIEVEHKGRRELRLVKTAEVKVGDIVVAGAGDTIAVDGHITEGTASVNQVSMTGEAEPVKKTRGNRVISGTVVEEGRIRIWAEHVGEETATARIRRYITSTLEAKSDIGLKATKLAEKLVPVTLGLAGLSYLLNRDVESVASVLQADYSCALKLATPVAFKSAISQAGREGIMIKGAAAVESLSEADTFVFDKTGTLTRGELQVISVTSFDEGWSEEDVLNLTASAEEHYFHPVAEAVVQAAKRRGFVHMHHEEVEFIVAHGVKTTVEGREVVIGSRHFLEDDEKIPFDAHREKIEACLLEGKTVLYVGYGGRLLGTIGMVDSVRDNAAATIARLKALGVEEIVMITGDIAPKAQRLAAELGIDTVYAGIEPQGKAGIIQALQAKGRKVAFIGDGINDAPALLRADVGISMEKGADIAKATADVSLLIDNIAAVADIKELSDKTMRLVHANFNTTVGINSLILAGAALGLFSPLTTAVLHNGTTIGLLANSMKGIRLDSKR